MKSGSEPSQPDVPTEKAKQMHINWNPLGFLSDLSANKIEIRFPPDVWQAFFCRSFGAPIHKMLAHAQSRTLCSCKMGINPLGENFHISLRDGLVIDVSFVCEFKGSSRAPEGWNNSVRHTNDVLQARANVKNNKYKDVYGLARRLHLPSQVCPVRSTLTFFGFSGFLRTGRCGRTMRV